MKNLDRRFHSAWSFGNPWMLRFFPEAPDPAAPPAAPPATPPAAPPAEPPAAPPAAPAPILNQPVPIMNADGTFVESWRQHSLIPEDLRNDPSLGVIKTFPDLVKRTINAVKMVGKDKIVLPNERSKPEEWESFYTAIGRPAKAEEYKGPQIPEELQGIFSDDRLQRTRERAFKYGVPQKLFQQYMEGEIEEAKQILADEDKLDLQDRQNSEKALRTEFGAAYDERVHVANRLIAEAFPNEEQKMEFLEKFGTDPDFIRFASRIGAKLGEHTALIAQLTQKTTEDVKKRISELQNTKGYMTMDNTLTKEQRQAITDEIRELTKQLQPAKAG